MFSLIEEKKIASLSLSLCRYLHRETGLELIHLKNKDEQKTFHITFRTPPADNSGVFHILEHSVLCGSDKYRAKDLFVEIMKGSINTYLNAMTFSDKTMYPAASMHNKDFFNLMSVYLDTAFNPLIHENEYFFLQEGWYHKLLNKRSPIEIGGIVYNEMKGAYGSPERLLIKSIDELLYKGSPYEYDAGGVPAHIPSLSYEGFLNSYDSCYSPGNCLFFLYGNADINKTFELIEEALRNKKAATKPNINFRSKEEAKGGSKTVPYSVSSPGKEEAYFALSYLTAPHSSFKASLSLELLSYILSGTDASPLKLAVSKSGICKEFQTAFRTSSFDTSIVFIAKKTRAERFDEFSSLITSTLKDIAENRIDPKLIEGALNKWEFYFNDEDYGSRPKGLFLGIIAASAWVYGADIAEALSYKDMLEEIRLETPDYFNKLIKQYILGNNKRASVILEPKQDLIRQEEDELCLRLDTYKKSLNKDELNELVLKTKALDKFIKKPVPKRVKRKIPILLVRDIKKGIRELNFTADEAGSIYMSHEKEGISYLNLSFNCGGIPEALLPYLGFLKELLGKTDNDLINEINIYAGAVNYSLEASQLENGGFVPRLTIKIKTLTKNAEKTLKLILRIISPCFNKEKIESIRRELLVRLQSGFVQNGHSAAISKALSAIFPAYNFNELTGGISFYESILRVSAEEIIEGLHSVAEALFTKENLLIAQSSHHAHRGLDKELVGFKGSLRSRVNTGVPPLGINLSPGEAIIIDSGVSYNAKAYNLYENNDKYSGRLQVARSVLNLDYLWHEIRNKNSAYGCGMSFNRNGSLFFYSYRDPELEKTYKIFDKSFEFLSNYNAESREFNKLIINAIKPYERPLKPDEALDIAVQNHILGITDEKRQTEREEILSSKIEHINHIGEVLEKNLKNGSICTLGSSKRIEGSSLFSSAKKLPLT